MARKLIEGFERFCTTAYRSHDALMPQLASNGQNPDYFIISCIDSRANPGTIFDTPPGTFFGHNAMGAIVRPYQKGTALAAALHFALEYNEVKEIIVLGHTGCGAVKALVDSTTDEEIQSFVEIAKAGLKNACALSAGQDSANLYRVTEEQIVLLSARNLQTYPSVQKALTEGRVAIRPWLFDLHDGTILEYETQQKKFISFTQPQNRPEQRYA